MKKIVKIIIAIVVVALLIVAAVKTVKAKKAAEAKIPVAKTYPIVAKSYTPKLAHVRLTLPYLAVVGNDADIVVSSRIAGRVEWIKKSGSRVKKGEEIARLDTTDIEGNIQSTRAEIEAARISLSNLLRTHKRTKELLAVGGASIEQSQKESTMIAAARAKIDALREKLKALQNNLSYAQIKAVTDGVVSKTFASEGAMAMPGKPLLQIAAQGKTNYLLMRIPGSVPVKGVLFHGKRYDVQPLGSTFNGLPEYKVYVDDTALTSGDRVEASVVVFDGEGIRLPFDAVLNRDDADYVLKVAGDHAEPFKVHIVQSGEEGLVVQENIADQKLVLAKPDILLRLTSGYALRIKE